MIRRPAPSRRGAAWRALGLGTGASLGLVLGLAGCCGPCATPCIPGLSTLAERTRPDPAPFSGTPGTDPLAPVAVIAPADPARLSLGMAPAQVEALLGRTRHGVLPCPDTRQAFLALRYRLADGTPVVLGFGSARAGPGSALAWTTLANGGPGPGTTLMGHDPCPGSRPGA